MHVGSFPIHCQDPACPVVIEVPILATLGTDSQGRQEIETWPDLHDVWAHAWAHVEGAA